MSIFEIEICTRHVILSWRHDWMRIFINWVRTQQRCLSRFKTGCQPGCQTESIPPKWVDRKWPCFILVDFNLENQHRRKPPCCYNAKLVNLLRTEKALFVIYSFLGFHRFRTTSVSAQWYLASSCDGNGDQSVIIYWFYLTTEMSIYYILPSLRYNAGHDEAPIYLQWSTCGDCQTVERLIDFSGAI